jgi:tetratricopeptide (TPR) repeat protein
MTKTLCLNSFRRSSNRFDAHRILGLEENHTMKILRFVCLGFVIVLPLLAGAAGDGATVQVELRPHKTDLLIGEPLFVLLRIRHIGSEDTTDGPVFYWGGIGVTGLYPVYISRDGQSWEIYDRGMELTATVGGFARPRLQPGQFFDINLTITIMQRVLRRASLGEKRPSGERLAQLAFPDPGQYFIRALYGSAERAIWTEPVSIAVRRPSGEDAEVWDRIQQSDLYREFLQFPTDKGLITDPETSEKIDDPRLAELAAIVAEHPDSVYSQYLALALGKHYHSGGRLADARQQAIRYFKLASEMKQVPAVREEAMLRYGGILFMDERYEESRRVAEQALREFPDGRLRDNFQTLRDESINPPPINPLGDAEKKLRREGFDTSVIDADTHQQLRMAVIEEVDAEVRAGKLPRRRREYELARRFEEALRAVLARDLPPPASD